MTDSTPTFIESFKACYRDFHQADLSKLNLFYAGDVVFKDPIHEIRGLVAVEDYMENLKQDLSECRFEYLDEQVGDRHAYIKWVMHYRHKKLGNRLISVRGVSHLQIDEKIQFQEDFYDVGAMLYEHLPMFGKLIQWLRKRLAR